MISVHIITYCRCLILSLFFFNDTATTEIYTLSLHDALPISVLAAKAPGFGDRRKEMLQDIAIVTGADRKSTRLNSSHQIISYAVFCLKKKTTNRTVLNEKIATM